MPSALLDWLTQRYPRAKRTTLRRMIQSGRVVINGRAARSFKDSIGDGDRIVVRDPVERNETRGATLPFPIVHEDEDILVIDKPAGLLTSTVPREKRPTALAIVRAYVREREPRARIGLIHRLDRDASGLLVFSKNNAAYDALKGQFFHHTVERVYTAVVRGKPNPPAGRIESRLIELPDGRVVVTRQHGRGQSAVTEYETLATAGEVSLVRVKLYTGRKHQIRAHFAQRGTPILNDPVYDDSRNPTGRLMLVATQLSLAHPRGGARATFRLDAPAEMVKLVRVP